MNSKTFSVYLKHQKDFAIKIYGFAKTVSARFLTRNTIRIVATFQAFAALSKTISAGKSRITISVVKLLYKPTQTIGCRRIRIIVTSKLTKRAITTIQYYPAITASIKMFKRAGTIIPLGPMRITMAPLVGAFHKLSDYDALTLAELDAKTLAEMDYSST